MIMAQAEIGILFMKKSKKNRIKWYKACSWCGQKIRYKDEYGYPVYYINKWPLRPYEWDNINKINVYCGPVCGLEHHEKMKCIGWSDCKEPYTCKDKNCYIRKEK